MGKCRGKGWRNLHPIGKLAILSVMEGATNQLVHKKALSYEVVQGNEKGYVSKVCLLD
jgi:hypothetical protein